MTHVAKSAEREEPPVEGTREYGVEWLREIQRQLATKDDPTKQPDVPCQTCGMALDVRRSRHAFRFGQVKRTTEQKDCERFGIYHPRNGCALSEQRWHIVAASREAAIAEWRRINL